MTRTCTLTFDSIEVLGRCCCVSKLFQQFLEEQDVIWKNFFGGTELRNGMSWKNTARALSLLTLITSFKRGIIIAGDEFYINYNLWPLHRTVLDLKLIMQLKSTSNLSLQDIKVWCSYNDECINDHTYLWPLTPSQIILRPYSGNERLTVDELIQSQPSRGKFKKMLNYFKK